MKTEDMFVNKRWHCNSINQTGGKLFGKMARRNKLRRRKKQ